MPPSVCLGPVQTILGSWGGWGEDEEEHIQPDRMAPLHLLHFCSSAPLFSSPDVVGLGHILQVQLLRGHFHHPKLTESTCHRHPCLWLINSPFVWLHPRNLCKLLRLRETRRENLFTDDIEKSSPLIDRHGKGNVPQTMAKTERNTYKLRRYRPRVVRVWKC